MRVVGDGDSDQGHVEGAQLGRELLVTCVTMSSSNSQEKDLEKPAPWIPAWGLGGN